MRRLRPLDKVLLAVLVPLWIASFGLCLRAVVEHPPVTPPVGIRADEAGGYPVVVDLRPELRPAETDLRRGDRLLKVGDVDLRGVGPLGFYARFVAEAAQGRPPPEAVYERDGRRGETAFPEALAWPPFPVLSLGFFATALVLYLRAQSSPFHRSVSRAFLIEAIALAAPVTGGATLNLAGLAMAAVSWSIAYPVCLRALLLFPNGAPSVSIGARLGPWLFAVMGPLGVSTFSGFLVPRWVSIPLFQALATAYLMTLLIVVARAYRRADAVGRRQIRWVTLGFYGALAPIAALTALVVIDKLAFGESLRLYALLRPSYAFGILIPLSVLFAIARYNFLDVDRLLSATASYNVVLVALVGAGLVVVPRLAELASRWLGIDARTSQTALALLMAVVVVPAHHRLRPRIDRVFFKERYALDHGMTELIASLSICADAGALTRRVGEELHRLLHPEACVVYALDGDLYSAVFVEGRAVPPAFEAACPLVATLRGRRKPLALSDAGRRPDAATLGPFDRAALETLQAEVVVPVRSADLLLGFVCLGPKRSGDVYTSTDVAHLAALAEATSSRLQRFDQEQTVRKAQEMRDALRRYVPGAIAAEIASGGALDASRREVSVLFVDIRGYTSFAEARRADEIFSTVNRYTETVSEIVRKHGGSVVEFNGDGMMAVFGAPRELPHKEVAAVDAGREIAAAVAALPVTSGTGADGRLSVGVGIATGDAFVGNLRAADRMIWSAIGNTTNLAARLQGLSRELGAAIVIDAATRAALGPAGDGFDRREATAIRGRSDVQDVYSLALVAAQAGSSDRHRGAT